MKSLFKYSLDSHEQRTVEDLKLKQIALNNLNIIKHQIPFKCLIHIIYFFCVSRIEQFLIKDIFLHCLLDCCSVSF